jgi:AcrR family transcriptional regulator
MNTKKPVRRRKLDLNRVQLGILKMLLDRSPEEMTFAKISKECKIPRATLYYYFGNSRSAMLEEAIRFGMQQFIQLDEFSNLEAFPNWKAFEKNRMTRSLRRYGKIPWIITLYFRYRNEPHEIGETIRRAEEKYFQQMMIAWKHFNRGVPSLPGIRFAGYLKLGFFFGFAHDHAWWNSRTNRTKRDEHLDRFLDFLDQSYRS